MKFDTAPAVRSFRGGKALALAGASLLVLQGAAAFAQSPAATPASAQAADSTEASGDQLEDIVITARRISENVQTTPVSVSAVSAQEIEDLNIVRLENLQQLAPNLTVIQNGPSSVAPLLYIRGIGSNSVALYSEPPVAIYIDGVYTPRPTQAAFDLPDLDGAQVLRGPQGTLFGRNTTGGAILLTTQTPRTEASANLRVSYGSDNDFVTSAVVHTGELGTSGVRAKIVAQTHDRDGWVEFPGYDKDEWGGSLHSYGGSLTLAKDFGDSVTVSNAFSYSKLKSAVGWQTLAASANAIAYFGQSPSLGGPPFLLSRDALDLTYRHPALVDNEAEIESFGDRLTIDVDVSDAFQLKSISAYSELDQNLTGQLGGSAVVGRVNRLGVTRIEPVATFVTPAGPGRQNQFSQEFNASGKFGDFSYVAGLYYFREKVNETIRTLQITAPTAVLTAPLTMTDRSVVYAGVTNSYAGFGQVSWRPSSLEEKFELTGGIRFTQDDKDIQSQTFATSSATGLTTITGTSAATGLPAAGLTGINPSTGSGTWKNTGWLASASYELTDDIFAFARASSAFRAGGFNSASTNAPPYDPETSTTYEAGLKTELLDRRLRFNATGFISDYKALQVNQYFGPPRNTNFISNSGTAVFKGFELEATAILGGGFRVDADYGRIYPKYKTFTIGATPLPAVCTTSPNDPSCFQNAANSAFFQFLAKETYRIGAQWESPETSIGTFTLRSDYAYRSSARLAALVVLAPNTAAIKTGAQKDLSARLILSDIPLGSGKSNLKLQVYGENLLDHRYYVTATDLTTTLNGIFNRPRSYGVILSAEF